MSPRRLILALGLGTLTLAGIGGALRPWSVETGRAAAFVGGALEPYGLALTADGPAEVTLLPSPHLSFTRTRLASGERDGPVLIEGGRLTIVFSPLALLSGQAEIGSVALDGARIAAAGDPRWAAPLARLSERLRQGGGGHPHRIGLSNATIAGIGDDGDARDVAIDVAWPAWSSTLDGSASLTWRGARTSLTFAGLRPNDFAAGARTPFSATLAWPEGSIGAEGSAGLAEDRLRLAGRARLETRSLPATLAWIGRDAPLLPLSGAFALDGRFESDGRSATWQSLRVTVGGNVLEGAGSLSLAGPRASIQATLAAESLNLAPVLGALVRMFDPDTGARSASVALAPLTGGDLDLRLSAAAARAGPVLVQDLAASVLVRDGSVEVALNRASLQGGTLKGRVALQTSADDPAETEVRAQGALDRVDLGALLSDLGESRWLLGPTQGQFALESGGRDAAGGAARVGGRAVLAMENGTIAGLDLADVVHRNGAVAPGALARRNGRTAFERAAVTLRFGDGVGEIDEGFLKAPNLTATLRGRMSLPGRRLDARAVLNLREPGRSNAFEIAGPWDAVTVRAAVQGGIGPDAAQRGGEAVVPGPLQLPASLSLPGGARAFAP
ncbi:AsmA family protein [Methylobacterium trifolii]|uniref:AsmA domain-containing protein n=1 Tax=Methylobacterium trifolii TaxID=1003092 RepID=A0ABQ4UAB4_9HYPH|nr:AsmA-like C-terminal region-containing protein [Methylobacterium trifolii]GJE62690.1 hypothetical protein MPOCJGCO_4824 [Methylobacterium trifolii]